MSLYTPYQTPAGCRDVPFIYLYDGTALTNGTNQNNLSLKLDGDSDFILRRIAGASSVARTFNYKNASLSRVFSQNMAVSIGQRDDIGVLPEKVYPRGGQIVFDLGTVAKSTVIGVPTDFLSYIAFQGVKRFEGEAQEDDCPYYPQGFSYQINIPALNWARGDYRRFVVRVDAHDFELHRLMQVQTNGAAEPGVVGVFNWILYDETRYPLMSAPVPDAYIIDNLNPAVIADPVRTPGVFPVPPRLYRVNSQIVIDLYAVETTPSGDAWQIILDGVDRIPLSGPLYQGVG